MKKILAGLLALSLLLCAGCSAEEPDSGSDENVWGVLENMNVRHEDRADSMILNFWWDQARLTTPDHVLIISEKTKEASFEPLKSEARSVDTLYCQGLSMEDGAFESAVKVATADYDFRQIMICLSRTAGLSDEAYAAELQAGVRKIRSCVPQSEISYFSFRPADIAVFEGAVSDDNARAVLVENNLFGQDWTGAVREEMESCTLRVDPVERDNTDFIREKREEPEWTNLGFSDANLQGTANCRVLLVGDSISWGYRDAAEARLGDSFAVDHVQTSRGVNDIALLRELEFMAAQYNYDVIHFNVGLHRHGQTPEEYAADLAGLIRRLTEIEPDARLLFSFTTPVSEATDLTVPDEAENADIRERNRLAEELCARNGIPVLDLYTLALGLPKIDTVHYQPAGYETLGAAVADFILQHAGEVSRSG